jgi:hypothetical protein
VWERRPATFPSFSTTKSNLNSRAFSQACSPPSDAMSSLPTLSALASLSAPFATAAPAATARIPAAALRRASGNFHGTIINLAKRPILPSPREDAGPDGHRHRRQPRIGRSVAQRFAEEGARVAPVSRSEKGLLETASEIERRRGLLPRHPH